jgi:2-octaprenyl-6-methoxyphenol hydroxylase
VGRRGAAARGQGAILAERRRDGVDTRYPAGMTPAPSQQLHDVLIVGGGLVGASLAIALDRCGLDVGLVEATPGGTLPAVFDERNLSFADATVNALDALGVLRKLRAPPGPIRCIHVSRQGDFGRLKLVASDYGREAFGQVVVARDFGLALEARLAELRALTRYRPARFVGLEDAGGDVRAVRLEDGEGARVVNTQLLVAADGTRSAVRDALGIGVDEHDYRQSLFVARLRAERAPDGTAYERLGDDGPTALLPRGDRRYGLVHGVASEDAEAVQALDEDAFLARVQQAFGWRVGRLLEVGARSVYPAMRVAACTTTSARAVLVGNAAQTLHPIGAQGFNLGLRDALTLAELIEAAGGDPGAEGLLQDYATRRAEDRERTLAFTDGLARATASRTPLLAPLRRAGLLALDRLPSAQAFLVGGAMGYRGDVPALCRAGRS